MKTYLIVYKYLDSDEIYNNFAYEDKMTEEVVKEILDKIKGNIMYSRDAVILNIIKMENE